MKKNLKDNMGCFKDQQNTKKSSSRYICNL